MQQIKIINTDKIETIKFEIEERETRDSTNKILRLAIKTLSDVSHATIACIPVNADYEKIVERYTEVYDIIQTHAQVAIISNNGKLDEIQGIMKNYSEISVKAQKRGFELRKFDLDATTLTRTGF